VLLLPNKISSLLVDIFYLSPDATNYFLLFKEAAVAAA
jgi:hypothetical protein